MGSWCLSTINKTAGDTSDSCGRFEALSAFHRLSRYKPVAVLACSADTYVGQAIQLVLLDNVEWRLVIGIDCFRRTEDLILGPRRGGRHEVAQDENTVGFKSLGTLRSPYSYLPMN
ncbi:hypothetical protein [Pseudomonas amygdali]|uniref:hypothetical protein n=1 Tax=Pseudomonas amygdali TaxID=47877 RepID=UPI0010567DF8|nr:hypothetical protein [Pseudomonas amygdali]